MRESKVCLLVSDDPDDHQILFEALREISRDIVLTILIDATQLEKLLMEKIVRADIIIVDTETDNSHVSEKIAEIAQANNLRVILYSDSDSHFDSAGFVLSKRMPFSKTKAELERIISG